MRLHQQSQQQQQGTPFCAASLIHSGYWSDDEVNNEILYIMYTTARAVKTATS